MNQIYFDIGQTLIDEVKFIKFLDDSLFELINGYGAKIDFKNYLTLRNNIIKTNKIDIDWVEYLVSKISKLILPMGYETIVLKEMKKRLNQIGTQLFFLFDDTIEILDRLSCSYKLGVISHDSPRIVKAFHSLGLNKYFNKIILSSEVRDKRISDLEYVFRMDNVSPKNCCMVGDRVDVDIAPAKFVGMKTIRYTGSIFRYQVPKNSLEESDHTIGTLKEILKILE